MNENDYAEHLLLKSLEQDNNHHRAPCNQQYHQNFSYHHNLHYQGQHYQYQQFGHQYQHNHNRRRHSYNDSYSHSHSHSQSQNYNYNHTHNSCIDEDQNDQLKSTVVSTVSLSTEEMDSFDEMDLFDGCDGGDDNSKSDFDDIDINVDIDIDAANAVADCDNSNNNNVVTPTRQKEQPTLSSAFLNDKSSNLKQDEGETTNNKNNDDHTASDPLLGQEQQEIKLEPSSPPLPSQKQSVTKNNSNMNNKGEKKTKHNNEDKLVDIIVRVESPTECDILCGQSRICASHVGNKRFQAVLDMYAARYDNATSKQEKMITTKEIVACIHNSGGRFLKFKNDDGMWEEISNVAARDKVSHALRTKVASWKRHQHQLLLQGKEGNNDSCGGSRSNGGQRRSSMPNGLCRRQRKRGGGRSQGSSSLSTVSNTSDGGSDSTAVVNDLMKAQREIFVALTTSSPTTLAVAVAVAAATTNNNDDHNHNHVIEPNPFNDKNRPESDIPCRRSSSYF